MEMNILFLCRARDLGVGQASLARALGRRGVRVECVRDDTRLDEDIRDLVARCGERPSLILQPELDFPLWPRGLTEIDIPTACLQIDTYAYTKRRIAWSMLFDCPIVFHPGYQEQFERAGHSGVITFYHAACRDLFDKPPIDRVFDVGSVGRTHAKYQCTRRRVLTMLASKYRLNEWERPHMFEEMAEIYRRSKIVVNVPRDDFPQDANMRAFEAMAAGCLLISRVPTELTAIGFQEGIHFVAYRDEREIVDLVGHYLAHQEERERIADAGREKVLAEHTYDNRADQLLREMERRSGRLMAPARQWSKGRAALHYLDYYAAHGILDCADREFREIAKSDFLRVPAAAQLIGRARVGNIRRKFASMKRRSDSRSLKESLRDAVAGLFASLPRPIQGWLVRHFRRPLLWWLFRAYGKHLTLAPAGPRGKRFRMWLDPVSSSDFILGAYEPGVARTLEEHIGPGAFCVDLGANVGYFSLLMSRLVGEGGQIVAFEPMPDTLEVLRENAELSGISNISVVGAAVTDRSGHVELLSTEAEQLPKTASLESPHWEGPTRTTTVPAVKLDEYFAGAARLPDLIKMDVEGAEISVLNGARETIRRARPTLVIEIHRWESPMGQQVVNLLSELGYSARIFDLRAHEAHCLAIPAR